MSVVLVVKEWKEIDGKNVWRRRAW